MNANLHVQGAEFDKSAGLHKSRLTQIPEPRTVIYNKTRYRFSSFYNFHFFFSVQIIIYKCKLAVCIIATDAGTWSCMSRPLRIVHLAILGAYVRLHVRTWNTPTSLLQNKNWEGQNEHYNHTSILWPLHFCVLELFTHVESHNETNIHLFILFISIQWFGERSSVHREFINLYKFEFITKFVILLKITWMMKKKMSGQIN